MADKHGITIFISLFQMVCRDISCAMNAPLRSYERTCKLIALNLLQNECFVLFAKLKPMGKAYFRTFMHSRVFQDKLSDMMARELPPGSFYETRIYSKLHYTEELMVDYFVAKLSIDFSGYLSAREFVERLEETHIQFDYVDKLIQMYVEFAYYNATIDEEDNLILPSSDGSGVDSLIKVYQIINGTSTVCSETTPIYLKKVHIYPFVTVALQELNFKFDHTYLIVYAGSEEFVFSEWQYNLEGELVQLCLEDFEKLYNAMPERPSLNGAWTPASMHQSLVAASISVLSLTIIK